MAEPTTIEELESWHRRRGACPTAPTIDAAVLLLPERRGWERGPKKYFLRSTLGTSIRYITASVPITGHTPEDIRRDLLALARLAWILEGAEQ